MDQKQLDAIKERLENATPAPWEIEPLTGLKTNETTIWMDTDDYLEVHGISIIKSTNNAIFLLNAIEDVPALLAEVERLREALKFYDNDELYPDEDLGVIARRALGGEAND